MKTPTRWLLVGGALAATSAVGYAQMQTYNPLDAFRTPTGSSFFQVLSILDQVALKPVERDKLIEGAIRGMLAVYDDPYTRYIPPAEAARDNQDREGEFFGIGVTFTATNLQKGTGGRIEAVYRGRPADLAGVQVGDEFRKIDGKDVTNLPQNDIVGLIRGKENTKVKITFGRGNTTYDVEIERRRIEIVTVESAMLPNNVGYIALNDFSNQKVNEQFPKAIADLKAKGATKLILDLRNNPGGLLPVACNVVDQFLESGPIVKARARDGAPGEVGCPNGANARAQASDFKGKLAVIVNGGSASASEITAGALQDTGRATIVGEKTFGKGVVQVVPQLPNGGAVAVTYEEWLTPKGRSINKEGVKPDVVVADTRTPKLVTFEGTGAKPGEKVTMTIGGRTVTATADAEGKFTFSDTPQRRAVSGQQGEALVDPKTDAQLARAIEIVNAR